MTESDKSIAARLEPFMAAFAQHRSLFHSRRAELLVKGARHAASHRHHRVFFPGEARHDFNLFRLLGIDRREVKTHSAMLRELLDPSGVHGQGNLFLRAILPLLWPEGEKSESFPNTDVDDGWVVHREMTTELGRLDLVLENRRADIAIVIENKVDAGDQDGQIARYHDWQEKVQRRQFGNRLLVYLTPKGHEPSPEALGKRPRPSGLVLLSYHHDIGPALEGVQDEIHSADIRSLVRQYVSLIRNL